MNRSFLVVALVLVLGAGAVFFATRDTEPEVAEATTTAPVVSPIQVSPPVVAAPQPETCSLVVGDRFAYALSASSTARMTDLSRNDAAPPVDFSVEARGTLVLQALSRTATGTVVSVRLDELRLATPTPLPDMGSAFLIEVGDDCRLARFARGNRVTIGAARNQQALLWESQFSLVNTSQAFTGTDGLGRFSGRIERTHAGIERFIDKYPTMWRGGERDVRADGRMVVTFSTAPWFDALSTTQHVATDGTMVESRLALTRRPGAKVSFSSQEIDEANYIWEDLLPLQSARHSDRQVTEVARRRREAVAGQSLEQALAGLTARATTPGVGLQDTWPELASYFEAHPEQIGSAIEQLREGTLDQAPARMMLYVALGNAQVPQARDALLEIKRDLNAPPIDRTRALFSLIDRDDVGPTFARELATDSQALTAASTRGERYMPSESLLALTTMAGLRGDVEVRELAADSVRAALLSSNAAVKRVALKALGNTGDASLISAALPSFGDGDPQTREAAAMVFRRMPPAMTDDTTADWLSREKHPFVKAKIYEVVRSQHFDTQQPASARLARQALVDLKATRSQLTRKHITRLIAKSEIAQDSSTREALKSQARWEFKQGHDEVVNEYLNVLTPEEAWEVLR